MDGLALRLPFVGFTKCRCLLFPGEVLSMVPAGKLKHYTTRSLQPEDLLLSRKQETLYKMSPKIPYKVCNCTCTNELCLFRSLSTYFLFFVSFVCSMYTTEINIYFKEAQSSQLRQTKSVFLCVYVCVFSVFCVCIHITVFST